MRPSKRLDRIPPYLFAELERKIAAKRAAGVDVISLGIGDPDTPTYAPIAASAQRAVADPSTHQYTSHRRPRHAGLRAKRRIRAARRRRPEHPSVPVQPGTPGVPGRGRSILRAPVRR